jgi:hypothetical protein
LTKYEILQLNSVYGKSNANIYAYIPRKVGNTLQKRVQSRERKGAVVFQCTYKEELDEIYIYIYNFTV